MTGRIAKHIGPACFSLLVFAFLAAPANAEPHGRKTIAPESVRYDVPTLHSWVELAAPAYLAGEVEETPYQLVQLCGDSGRCRVLLDLRGLGGVTVSADPSIAFSPDRLYLIVLRMIAIDPEAKTFRKQYYETYGLREGILVNFKTANGEYATTDNILGWSSQHPHALTIGAGLKGTELAYPVDDE